MVSNDFCMLLTGSRCFAISGVARMDLFHTGQNVRLVLHSTEKEVILDENESETVREWAHVATQMTVAANEDLLIHRRCVRQDSINRANRMNRAASRRARSRSAHASDVAANVVDISTKPQRAPEPISVPAA